MSLYLIYFGKTGFPTEKGHEVLDKTCTLEKARERAAALLRNSGCNQIIIAESLEEYEMGPVLIRKRERSVMDGDDGISVYSGELLK